MTAPACARNAPILSHRAERVLVEGCRAGIAGCATRCVDCWLVGWTACAREIGPRDARRLIGDILAFSGAAVRAADRPLAALPGGSRQLTRDEILLLAAVAGAQNGAAPVARLAAHHLAGAGADLVEAAAREFADALGAVNQQLLPIPEHVVVDVAARPPGARFA